MKNLIIIGKVEDQTSFDYELPLLNLLKDIDILNLQEPYRSLYFKRIYDDCIADEDNPNYQSILHYFKSYFSRFKFLDFSKYEFNKEFVKNELIKSNPMWSPIFNGHKNKIKIMEGVNYISAPPHYCSPIISLLLPYLMMQIKSFDNPTIICNSNILHNCDVNEGFYSSEIYKLTDTFMACFQEDCLKNKVLFIEYTGESWRNA